MVIAIDGPAGAGKSTVAKAVAARLGFTYFDTGAMYRCVALAAFNDCDESHIRQNAAPDAGGQSHLRAGTRSELGAIARSVRIELGTRILLDGQDVTEAIRAPEVSQRASQVATDPAVRQAMVARQQELMSHGDWVAEGRDVGTVIKPDAELKLYLTASSEERARRRAAQTGGDYASVLAEQRERDTRDMNRADSPMGPAPGAIELDTTGLALDEVIDRIVELAQTTNGF